MRTRRWTAGAFALAMLVAGCGDDDDSATDTGGADTTEAAGGTGGVTMADTAFDPTALTVAAGASIPLTNEDTFAHTFTIDDADIDVEVAGSESGEATAPSDPGDYEFRCRFHSNMTGTLTVE